MLTKEPSRVHLLTIGILDERYHDLRHRTSALDLHIDLILQHE